VTFVALNTRHRIQPRRACGRPPSRTVHSFTRARVAVLCALLHAGKRRVSSSRGGDATPASQPSMCPAAACRPARTSRLAWTKIWAQHAPLEPVSTPCQLHCRLCASPQLRAEPRSSPTFPASLLMALSRHQSSSLAMDGIPYLRGLATLPHHSPHHTRLLILPMQLACSRCRVRAAQTPPLYGAARVRVRSRHHCRSAPPRAQTDGDVSYEGSVVWPAVASCM